MTSLLAAILMSNLSPLSIVPWPNAVEVGEGSFQISRSMPIVATGKALATARLAQRELSAASGFETKLTTRASGPCIRFAESREKLGPEGYRLRVDETGISVEAKEAAGFFYGYQTLKQLLSAEIYGGKAGSASWAVPAVDIRDEPRFRWRGAHMDVARHFQPKEFVLRFLDLMALHKLNTFHFHLTDDQGWRIEIKKFPKLTSVGGWRKDTMLTYSPATYSGKPHGGFYTQEDLREIVAYAAERHITVVPEIEMPGHAQAAIAAYPELGHSDAPLEVWTMWGVSENVFNVKDSTISFLKDVLAEVIDIFPSKFIHVGGDECPKKQWKEDAFTQAKMRSLGLKDEHELQSWFIRQMDAFLDAKGRRLVGWSEILEGGLAPGATLMVWLGDDGALQAAGSGHDVVMAQTSHTYLDYYQSRDTAREPHAIGGFLPIDKVYSYNPVLPKMTPEMAKHVLGCQFQLWSEYIRDSKHMEYMAFPRACALSEVAWTQPERKQWPAFRARLETHLKRLDALGVNYRKLDPVSP
jgi:hexosaminidase